jgi:hypothetical protein
LLSTTWRTPNDTIATTGIATGVTVPQVSPRSSCQDGITLGTSSAATASASTIGAARVPRRATLSAVMYRHRTKAAARANGTSARNNAKQMPYRVQNRVEPPCGPPAMSTRYATANRTRIA